MQSVVHQRTCKWRWRKSDIGCLATIPGHLVLVVTRVVVGPPVHTADETLQCHLMGSMLRKRKVVDCEAAERGLCKPLHETHLCVCTWPSEGLELGSINVAVTMVCGCEQRNNMDPRFEGAF